MLNEIYNKNNFNKILLNCILNRNKSFLKNLYKLFRLENNNTNYIELIDDIIYYRINLQGGTAHAFIFPERELSGI